MFNGRQIVMRQCRDGKKRPNKSRRTESEITEDFWARVDRGSPDKCWEWKAGRNGKTKLQSYGVFWACRIRHKAHRFAFEISIRKLKHGELVCHTCDNPPCCNPAHLYAGSNRDNVLDCIKRGRRNMERGTKRYNAVLDDRKVREIRQRYQKRKVGGMGIDRLAEIYGVGRTMIYAIIMRRRWAHVN